MLSRAKRVEDAEITKVLPATRALEDARTRPSTLTKSPEMRDWRTQALRFADPRNIDPMQVASETLGQTPACRYKTKLKEHESSRRAPKQDGDVDQLTPFTLSSSPKPMPACVA